MGVRSPSFYSPDPSPWGHFRYYRHRFQRTSWFPVGHATLHACESKYGVKKPLLPDPSPPRVLGLDDFAFRRGHTYETLLLDRGTHQPVDLLADRTSESLAGWLKQHPEAEIISRDRLKEYQRGPPIVLLKRFKSLAAGI